MARKSLFGMSAKNPALAKAISITSPHQFRASFKRVRKVKTASRLQKFRALVFAQNRAGAQLNRPNISRKERGQSEKIMAINIPRLEML